MSFEWNSDDDGADNSDWTDKPNNTKGDFNDSAHIDCMIPLEDIAENNHNDWDMEFATANQKDDGSDDENSFVDWEDADQPEISKVSSPSGVTTSTVPDTQGPTRQKFPELKPVTVNLSDAGIDEKHESLGQQKRKRPRRRNIWKFAQLSHTLQATLSNLQQAHLLSWISHVVFVSTLHEEGDVIPTLELALAASVIPSTFIKSMDISDKPKAPSVLMVQDFCTWFKQYHHQKRHDHLVQRQQNRRGRRQQRRGHRSSLRDVNPCNNILLSTAFKKWIHASFLGSSPAENNEDTDPTVEGYPVLLDGLFSNLLCLTLMRHAFGWRVRWCMVLDNVIGLDLTVNHPFLLAGTQCLSCWTSLASAWRNQTCHSVAFACDTNSTNEDSLHTKKHGIKKRKRQHDSNKDKNKEARNGYSARLPVSPAKFLWGFIEVQVLDEVGSWQNGKTTKPRTVDSKATLDSLKRHRWTHVDVSDDCFVSATNSINRTPCDSVRIDQPMSVGSKFADLQLQADRFSGSSRRDNTENLMSTSFQRNKQNSRLHSNSRRPPRNSVVTPSPVAFVVAVEHAFIQNGNCEGITFSSRSTPPFRCTDVTPRYSSSRITTLQRRCLSRLEIQNELADNASRLSVWWTSTLDAINKKASKRDSIGTYASKADPKPVTGAGSKDLIDRPSYHVNSTKKGRVMSTCVTYPKEDNELGDFQCSETLQSADFARQNDDNDIVFSNDAETEPMPTSKTAFANHPIYILKSQLGKTHVVEPSAKVCGLFAGEFVYLRRDVTTALEPRAWLYKGRKVKSCEQDKPAIRLSPRKKPASKQRFKPLRTYGVGVDNDNSERKNEMENASSSCKEDEFLRSGDRRLYALWQTVPWAPEPVGPQDPIPLNEHKNVELGLLNPGLVHIDMPGEAVHAAKVLGVPYAPCLIGFGTSGKGGPVVRGIVVHSHNAAVIQQATEEIRQHKYEKENDERQERAKKLWKKLMVGILVKQRVAREYGVKSSDSDQAICLN